MDDTSLIIRLPLNTNIPSLHDWLSDEHGVKLESRVTLSRTRLNIVATFIRPDDAAHFASVFGGAA